jgi:CRP-like cAMP-binding protein
MDEWFGKNDRFGGLTAAKRAVLQDAAVRRRVIDARQDIRLAGDRTPQCHLLVDGLAFAYQLMSDGRRQILSLNIPGDFCDLCSLFNVPDYSVTALKPSTVAVIPHHALFDLSAGHQGVHFALWRDCMIECTLHREWIVNIGRRNAYQRLAHFFCEIYLRLRSVGLVHDGTFELPLTQADVADIVGLSLVHVNRTVQRLRADGLISWIGKYVIVHDVKSLSFAADFEPDYLIGSATEERAAMVVPSDRESAGGNGTSLAKLLDVLVHTAIKQAGGKARAAFYLADSEGSTLHHITGMPQAYARLVDGFAIGRQSLACGLAAATRHPVITPDVIAEPRWKQWLWLAKEFDYRACWSFPIEAPGGKIVGTFAMYYEEPTEATQRELERASALTRTAAAIITKH